MYLTEHGPLHGSLHWGTVAKPMLPYDTARKTLCWLILALVYTSFSRLAFLSQIFRVGVVSCNYIPHLPSIKSKLLSQAW